MGSFVDSIKPPVAQVKSLPVGASNYSEAAKIMQHNNNQTQAKLAKLGGSRRRYKKGGVSNGVIIYNPTVPYPEAGAGNNTIGSINKSTTSVLMQNQANAQYDKNALQGGSKKNKSLKKSKKHNSKKKGTTKMRKSRKSKNSRKI